MIPILYYQNTPIADMMTNGIGRLADCISCTCTEERNGIYEVEFQYPITGIHYNEISIGKIISCVPSEGEDRQPFIIYRRSAAINGVVTFNAYHYSYLLSYALITTHTYQGIANTFTGFHDDAIYLNIPTFTFQTDKTTSGEFKVKGVQSVKSLLCGQEGSVLDVFGSGEYYFNNTSVYLYANRGSDNGVTIRYGKNLMDIKDEIDASSLYESVMPFWVDASTETTVIGSLISTLSHKYWTDENGTYIRDENNVEFTFDTLVGRSAPLDLSSEYQSAPSSAQLNAKAASWLNKNKPWIPKRNITIDFVPLWQTEEYKDIAPVERVKLCDTVHVIYEELGVVATAKVIKTVWNVLLDRYDSIEVGQLLSDYRGYNGNLRIADKSYKIVNGIITAER